MLYLLLIIKCIYWLFYYDLLFGADAVFYSKPYPIKGLKDLAFLLYGSQSASLALYFIIPVIILAAVNLIYSKLYFITDFILWFLIINLHNKIYASLSGGDYLLNQFLLFNCVLSSYFAKPANGRFPVKILLHNFGVVAIMAQVVLVYALSALAKLNDHNWLSGNAVWLVSQTGHFSLPLLAALSKSTAPLFIFLNYCVLLYQCTFPFLVWLKRIKKPFVIAGILMHVYIALAMGLVSFGLIMLIAYVYFWPFGLQNLTTKSTEKK